MKRISITHIALVIIMAINFYSAVSEYISPIRDVYLSNAIGGFCALCYIISLSIKEYQHDNN